MIRQKIIYQEIRCTGRAFPGILFRIEGRNLDQAESDPKPRILAARLEERGPDRTGYPGSPITEEQLDETIQKLEGLGFRTYLSGFGTFRVWIFCRERPGEGR